MAEPIRILFLHHSVGRYLLRDGTVRMRLAAASRDVALWDHDYNKVGLIGPDGRPTGRAFPLPGDNTDPDGFVRLFVGEDAEASAARDEVLGFDVVAMKSCYPNAAIKSDAQLDSIMATYATLIGALGTRGDTQFVLATSPPLTPMRTSPEQARRARTLASWLAGTKAGIDAPNVAVFDLFDRLADPDDHRLRPAYRRRLPIDSHPNVAAGEAIGQAFADALLAGANAVATRPALA